MNRFALVVAAAATAFAVSPALAASVEAIQGRVSVNAGGQGFQRVAAPVTAAVGDIVSAGPRSSAEIVYPDGCRVKVEPDSMATVAAISPCNLAGNPGLIAAGAVGAVTIGIVALTGQSDDKPSRPASP